jgi:antitoxin HigA-1
MKPDTYKPIHPGAIIKEEIKSVGATIQEAADAIGIQRETLSRILNGHHPLTNEMAVRVSLCIGRSAEFWANLEIHHYLHCEGKKIGGVKKLSRTKL